MKDSKALGYPWPDTGDSYDGEQGVVFFEDREGGIPFAIGNPWGTCWKQKVAPVTVIRGNTVDLEESRRRTEDEQRRYDAWLESEECQRVTAYLDREKAKLQAKNAERRQRQADQLKAKRTA